MTMLYSTDFNAMETAIMPPVEKLERHGVASVRQRVTNLLEHLDPGKIASVDALEEYLVRHFTDGTIVLTPEQLTLIEEMSLEYEELI